MAKSLCGRSSKAKIGLAACILAVLSVAATTAPEADRLWQDVLQQSSGPGNQFANAEAAIRAAQEHLQKQEATLRGFLRAFPDDPRRYSATIRLSGVLAAKSRLLKQPALRAEARKILADLEGNSATPPPVKADAGFARLAQGMEESAGHNDSNTRDGLLLAIRAYDTAYPSDRRTAGLFAEIATLYDAQPAKKRPCWTKLTPGRRMKRCACGSMTTASASPAWATLWISN